MTQTNPKKGLIEKKAHYISPEQSFNSKDQKLYDHISPPKDHFNLPLIGVLTLRPEKVHVVLELELEDELTADRVGLLGLRDDVAEEGQAGQRILLLVALVEEETKVGEDHPELLPAVAVLELAQQVAAELIEERAVTVSEADARVAVPAHVHGRVGSMRLLLCQRWVIAFETETQLPNALPIIRDVYLKSIFKYFFFDIFVFVFD